MIKDGGFILSIYHGKEEKINLKITLTIFMEKMRAAVSHQHGSLDEVQIEEVEVPKIRSTDVLLKVKAFALNRLDVWSREGEIGRAHV